MHRNRTSIACCCLLAISGFVWAENRKPGLWEMTTTQTWQQGPGGGANSPFAGGSRTTLVCLTQEEINKYGAIVPHTRGCEVTNIIKKGVGMTADWVCSGAMSGKGTMESHLIDSDHAKGKVHFVGSIQARSNTMPIEWTSESSSVFKSANCGDVKPLPTSDR